MNNIFRFLKEKVDIDYSLCDYDEPENIQELDKPVHKPPTARDFEKKEPEIEATLQKPALPTQQPPAEVEKKNPIEGDEKPIEQKRTSEDKKPIVEDKKPIKEKKLNEPKVATTNNKAVKEGESAVTTKKVKSSTKNASTNNKKTEGQLNGNNSPSFSSKEQTNNKLNEFAASPTKDHNHKNNQKSTAGKPVTTNTTVAPATTETTFKSWAKLAAPAPSSDKVGEKVESVKPSSKNSNVQQNRPQLPQATYSPNSNVHINASNQEQPNISYNHQNQSHNTYNYPHQQQQMQYQLNNNHHYSHQQQHTQNQHHQQYHREGQQQNQYRTGI